MAIKTIMSCDGCPTLLEGEAFEVEFATRQLLPRVDQTRERQTLHLCGSCFDSLMAKAKPIRSMLYVDAKVQPMPKAKAAR